jgi:hypothetical protein
MLKIDRNIIRSINACGKKEDLHRFLQKAVELEHATIPPYLTAMYSLRPGTNESVASLIRSVVLQEMLHMTVSANILTAIGGSPQINTADFVPSYPGPLPMGIGEGLIVPIKAFSKELVKDVFMTIEEPEDPIPIHHDALAALDETFGTIGEFYAAIQQKIGELGDEIFIVGADKQVLKWFNSKTLFPIVDAASAIKAIDIVVVQGEGTHADPFESPDDPAHYYRFGEIYYGKRLIKTEDGFAYEGAPIPFDENGVYPMIDNPSQSMYLPGSHVDMLSRSFTDGYSCLLNALHESFNGNPARIDAAIGLMYELRLRAQTLMSTPIQPSSKKTAGPVFQYVTSEGAMA